MLRVRPGEVIEDAAGAGQQNAADDKGSARPKSIRRQPSQQAANAEHNGRHAVGLQGQGRSKSILLLQPHR